MEVLQMDATWSVRMPEEMKEKISAMITESGLNSKDFISHIIQTYELKVARKLQPAMDADIEELSLLTGRIHNIYINLCERVTSFQQQREEEFGAKLSEKDGMLSVFNDRIRAQEQKLVQCDENMAILKKQYEDICQQYAQTAEMYETHKALVLEYREKNDTLTGLLGEYQEFKHQIETLKQAIEGERTLCHDIESKLREKDNEARQLKAQLEEAKNAAGVQLQHRLESLNIEKDKEILALQKEHQKKLETIQQQYTDKIRELLDMIEELQKAKFTRKTPVKHHAEGQ
jgi:chromosome segregation ATPase